MSRFDLDDSLLEEKKTKNYEEDLKKARALSIRGQTDKALAIYNAILDEDYENEEALIGLLRVHSDNFRIFEGKEIEDDVFAIESICPDTKNEDYLSFKEKIKNQKQLNKEKEEEKSLEESIKREDRYRHFYFLADQEQRAREYEKAVESYKNALEYASTDAEFFNVYYYLSSSYYYLKKYDDAVKYNKLAIKYGDNYPSLVDYCYFEMGECFYEQKKYKEAIPYYEEAVERSYIDELVFIHLADCYYSAKINPEKVYDLYDTYFRYYKNTAKYYGDACFGLATLYENGFGVEKNKFKAEDWYRNGQHVGHQGCNEGIHKLYKK